MCCILRCSGRDRTGLDQCICQRDGVVTRIKNSQWFQCRKPILRLIWVSISCFFKDDLRNRQFKLPSRSGSPLPSPPAAAPSGTRSRSDSTSASASSARPGGRKEPVDPRHPSPGTPSTAGTSAVTRSGNAGRPTPLPASSPPCLRACFPGTLRRQSRAAPLSACRGSGIHNRLSGEGCRERQPKIRRRGPDHAVASDSPPRPVPSIQPASQARALTWKSCIGTRKRPPIVARRFASIRTSPPPSAAALPSPDLGATRTTAMRAASTLTRSRYELRPPRSHPGYLVGTEASRRNGLRGSPLPGHSPLSGPA